MLLYAACAIAALATIGCGKSGLDANGCRDDVKSEYYIRYCAERALGVVSYSNTTGTTTLNTGQSPISKFERTVGPFPKDSVRRSASIQARGRLCLCALSAGRMMARSW